MALLGGVRGAWDVVTFNSLALSSWRKTLGKLEEAMTRNGKRQVFYSYAMKKYHWNILKPWFLGAFPWIFQNFFMAYPLGMANSLLWYTWPSWFVDWFVDLPFLKVVIVNSYVGLPEGKPWNKHSIGCKKQPGSFFGDYDHTTWLIIILLKHVKNLGWSPRRCLSLPGAGSPVHQPMGWDFPVAMDQRCWMNIKGNHRHFHNNG